MHLCSSWYSYHSCCLLALSKVSLFVKAGATDLSSALRRAFIHFKSDAAETAFLCPEKKIFYSCLVVGWLFGVFFPFLYKVCLWRCVFLLGCLWVPFTCAHSQPKHLGVNRKFPLFREVWLSPVHGGHTQYCPKEGLGCTTVEDKN